MPERKRTADRKDTPNPKRVAKQVPVLTVSTCRVSGAPVTSILPISVDQVGRSAGKEPPTVKNQRGSKDGATGKMAPVVVTSSSSSTGGGSGSGGVVLASGQPHATSAGTSLLQPSMSGVTSGASSVGQLP